MAEGTDSSEIKDRTSREKKLRRYSKDAVDKCGLRVEALDQLSPSFVTLESLADVWPPNTLDSGYEPSPLNRDCLDYFSSDDENYHKKETEDAGSVRSTESERASEGCSTPASAILVNRKSTPPINIPKAPNAFASLSPLDLTEVNEVDLSGSDGETDFLSFESHSDRGTDLTTFRRPRSFTCPGSVRMCVLRPRVPFFVGDQFRKKINFEVKKNKDAFNLNRRRLSLVEPMSSGVPNDLRSLTLTWSGHEGRSHDLVRDLSALDGGGGHKRRVLVSTMPDFLVDRRTSAKKFEDNNPLAVESASHGTPVPAEEALARRRRGFRRRAMSCDVTMEATVGQALRRIADEFEVALQKGDEHRSFLTKVRHGFLTSYSRMAGRRGYSLEGASRRTSDGAVDPIVHDLILEDVPGEGRSGEVNFIL